jgi:hypothetical protein
MACPCNPVRGAARACAALVAATILFAGGLARAEDTEVRDFAVLVDNKPSGTARMTIQQKDDGTTHFTAESDVTVRILLVRYTYSYRGREIWKDGRLQQLSSGCNDDGKSYQVTAVAEGDGLRVRVNGREQMARADSWLTSYWRLPAAAQRGQPLSLIDADTGRLLQGQLTSVGIEQRTIAGQMQNVAHYRLTGSVNVELWYDGSDRVVRQEWIEQGHRTTLELSQLRR